MSFPEKQSFGIRLHGTNLALDVQGASNDVGASIILWDSKSEDYANQRWIYEDNKLRSLKSGLILSVPQLEYNIQAEQQHDTGSEGQSYEYYDHTISALENDNFALGVLGGRNAGARVALVQRDSWSAWLIPSLRRKVRFNSNAVFTERVLSALRRDRDFVESINVYGSGFPLDLITLLPFPKLRTLEFTRTEHTSLEGSGVLDVLKVTLTLESLRLWTDNRDRGMDLLIPILSSHPKLQNLDLTISKISESAYIPRLLRACRNYKPFVSESQIQDLSIHLTHICQRQAILIPLLQHCPKLERLEIVGLEGEELLKRIAVILKSDACQRLKRLLLRNVVLPRQAEVIGDIIRAIGSRTGSDDIDHSVAVPGSDIKGLTSFETGDLFFFMPVCLRSLIDYHSRTLTILDLSQECHNYFLPFVNVMTNLPGLKALKIIVRLLTQDMYGDLMSMETALRTP
ncbi:hypothetical protein BGX26_004952 [Mortierella sp. AD094]|nr:hypothetical protein BGX26_004952 [Mortierella sp. AD094]